MEACGGRRAATCQRGASLIEVALIVAVVAAVALVALRFVGTRSSSSLDAAGQTSHAAGRDGGGTGGSGGGTSGGTGGGGTDPGIPTTTLSGWNSGSGSGDIPPTIPGTTVPPTTTTTTSPTTTTTAAPTTTAPPSVATATLANGTARMISSSSWQAGATLTLVDQVGTPMAGATVTVQVRALKINWNGSQSWVTTTVDGTVDGAGHLALDTGPYKSSGGGRITKVEYTVLDVALAGDGTWDGGLPSLTVAAP